MNKTTAFQQKIKKKPKVRWSKVLTGLIEYKMNAIYPTSDLQT